MKVTIIDNPPIDMQTSLNYLSNGICMWPGCDKTCNTIVSILRTNREKSCFENSLALCEEHTSACSQNPKSSFDTLANVRHLLSTGKTQFLSSNSRYLPSREVYLETVATEVPKSSTLRCIYVGPLPFHPQWYFDLREGQTKMISMDRAISDALSNRDVKVTMIMRNDLRYFEKVKQDIDTDLIPLLIKGTLDKFNKLVNSNEYNNKVIFWDIGTYHLPIILDSACIYAIRGNARSPIGSGRIIKDLMKIEEEQERFDDLFSTHQNSTISSSDMNAFLQKLL